MRNLGFSFDPYVKTATSYDTTDAKTFDNRWPLSKGAYIFHALDKDGKVVAAATVLVVDDSGKIIYNAATGTPMDLAQFKDMLGKTTPPIVKFYVTPAYSFEFASAQSLLDATKGDHGLGPVPYGAYTLTVNQDGKAVMGPVKAIYDANGFKLETDNAVNPWDKYATSVTDLFTKFPTGKVLLVPVGAVAAPVKKEAAAEEPSSPPWLLIGGAAVLAYVLLKK